MSKSGQGFGAAASMLETVKGGLETIKSGKETYEKFKEGDIGGGLAEGVGTLSNLTDAAKSALTAAQFVAPAATAGLSSVTPALGLSVHGLNIAADTIRSGEAAARLGKLQYRKHQLEKRAKAGTISEDDKLMLKIAKQGSGIAKANLTEHVTSGIGNVIKLGGDAAEMATEIPMLSKVIGFGGTIFSKLGKVFSNSMKKDVRKQVVEEEMGLSKHIDEIMKSMPSVTAREAKHIALEALGNKSRKRRDAAAAITIDRTDQLIAKANAGNKDAQNMLNAMNVYKWFGKYNRNLVGKNLGLDEEGDSLEERWKKIRKTRENPFAV